MIDYRTKCFCCNHFRAYYSREFCHLFRERFGYCNKQNKIVNDDGYCNEWRRRRVSCKQHTSLAISAIDRIHEKISVVEQMLKEEIAVEKLTKLTVIEETIKDEVELENINWNEL